MEMTMARHTMMPATGPMTNPKVPLVASAEENRRARNASNTALFIISTGQTSSGRVDKTVPFSACTNPSIKPS